MKGTLLVLDGLDGCGKSTQSELLAARLEKKYPGRAHLISYPDYDSPSSALVKMYLAGEFSSAPGGVNAYAASTFYAADRYAGFVRHWRAWYEAGDIILASRYVSSNAMHQMGKLPPKEWDGFLSWLEDFEFVRLGLPRPDLVCYLKMEQEASDRLLMQRYGGDEAKKDLHERDRAYLAQCRKSADYAAKARGWTVLPCSQGGVIRPIEEISDALWKLAEPLLPAQENA